MTLRRISRIMLLGALAASLNTGCVTALIGAGAVGAVGAGSMIAADSRTAGTMIDDEAIELKGSRIISNNRELSRASKVEIVSVNGIVLLAGQCRYPDYVKYIKEKVAKLDGVKKVYSYIEDIEPVSLGQRSQDSWITSKVKTGLLFGEKINSGRFKVVTENSVVYLLGYVTRDEAARAVYVSKNIDGVRKIVRLFDYMGENEHPAPIFGEGDNPAEASGDAAGTSPAADKSSSSGAAAPVYHEESYALEDALPVNEAQPEPAVTESPAPAAPAKPAAEKPVIPMTEDIKANSPAKTSKPVPVEEVNVRSSSAASPAASKPAAAPTGVVNDDDDSFIIE